MCCESCGTNLDASKLHWERNDTKLGCRSSGTKLDASNLSFSFVKVAVPNGMLQIALSK